MYNKCTQHVYIRLLQYSVSMRLLLITTMVGKRHFLGVALIKYLPGDKRHPDKSTRASETINYGKNIIHVTWMMLRVLYGGREGSPEAALEKPRG